VSRETGEVRNLTAVSEIAGNLLKVTDRLSSVNHRRTDPKAAYI